MEKSESGEEKDDRERVKERRHTSIRFVICETTKTIYTIHKKYISYTMKILPQNFLNKFERKAHDRS